MTDERQLLQLLSALHSASLTHGAWVASFVIAIFAFLGLTISGENPLWNLGSLIILWLLCSFAVYFAGRIFYYSSLVTILTGKSVVDPFYPEIRFLMRELTKQLEIIKKDDISFRIAYQFRASGSIKSISVSILCGLILGLVLFGLGELVLSLG
jgi:hypothetical protein